MCEIQDAKIDKFIHYYDQLKMVARMDEVLHAYREQAQTQNRIDEFEERP